MCKYIISYEAKAYTVMVNISTNTNKPNNNLTNSGQQSTT
jgi:hypothetical protein